MTRFPFLFLGFLLISAAVVAGDNEVTLRVLTFNIRYDNPGDGMYSWAKRKPQVFALIQREKPGIACFQEVLSNQAQDLSRALPGYEHYYTGRDDGQLAGEGCPIYWDTAAYNFLQGSAFWLSETPDVPGSKSWSTACTRIATWVFLSDRKTGRHFFVFNTHLDHISALARENGTRVLLKALDSLAGKAEVILTGDLNSLPTDIPWKLITESGIRDVRLIADPAGKTEAPCTFIGFPAEFKPGNTIDYIFFRAPRHAVELSCEERVLNDNRDGLYPSDHLPVVADIRFHLK
jgi:endonuclease/exonuclease/phosphatase family metal-dependent hydrolase